jgi:hypothetical protein
MGPRRVSDISRSLLKKGFIQIKGRDHQTCQLCIGGEKMSIVTHYSHGAKECDDYILGQMARHLMLTRAQMNDLIDCQMSGGEYVEMLRRLGVVKA